jgi:Wiskott-Aldrich syndrome protein
VDSDGDEVTLSSEEELRDFYNSNVDNAIRGNQLIRFRVVQLGSIRDTDNFMELTSPPQSSTRNTFGRPTPLVFVDNDHLPFNDIFISSPLDREMDSPHAFVEVVDDDMNKENEFTSEMDLPPLKSGERPTNYLPPFLTIPRPPSR